MNHLKSIHIGLLIRKRYEEMEIDTERACNFFKCNENELKKALLLASMDTETLLKWSKFLEYDFFRIYTQHLILYAPQGRTHDHKNTENKTTSLPIFRKNIYTKEIIDFILELIDKNEKTKKQIIDEYRIPKTTLFKWIEKHRKNS